jgi:hypothetical protein
MIKLNLILIFILNYQAPARAVTAADFGPSISTRSCCTTSSNSSRMNVARSPATQTTTMCKTARTPTTTASLPPVAERRATKSWNSHQEYRLILNFLFPFSFSADESCCLQQMLICTKRAVLNSSRNGSLRKIATSQRQSQKLVESKPPMISMTNNLAKKNGKTKSKMPRDQES